MLPRPLIAALSLLLVGCSGGLESPVSPLMSETVADETVVVTSQHEGPTVFVSALSGGERITMSVRRGAGEVRQVVGSFESVIVRRGDKGFGFVQMDWDPVAVDIPTEKINNFRMEVRGVYLSGSEGGVVGFSGVGRLRDATTGRTIEFPVTGTAQRSSVDPDCVIFDLVGGGLFAARVELPGRFEVSP